MKKFIYFAVLLFSVLSLQAEALPPTCRVQMCGPTGNPCSGQQLCCEYQRQMYCCDVCPYAIHSIHKKDSSSTTSKMAKLKSSSQKTPV